MAEKPLSSGQKWFLRWVFLGFGGCFGGGLFSGIFRFGDRKSRFWDIAICAFLWILRKNARIAISRKRHFRSPNQKILLSTGHHLPMHGHLISSWAASWAVGIYDWEAAKQPPNTDFKSLWWLRAWLPSLFVCWVEYMQWWEEWAVRADVPPRFCASQDFPISHQWVGHHTLGLLT